MSGPVDPGTRRFIAAIIGAIGVVVLLDVLVIAVVHPDADFDGVRQILLLVVGSLLVLGGAVTFSWPDRGQVATNGGSAEPEGTAPSAGPPPKATP